MPAFRVPFEGLSGLLSRGCRGWAGGFGESDVEGLFLATGHFRNGILLAPGTAHHLARWMVEGRVPRELRPFRPARLAEQALAEQREADDANDDGEGT